MFERLVSSILTRLLGEYVEDSTFNTESVKLGIWRGEGKREQQQLKVYSPARHAANFKLMPFL